MCSDDAFFPVCIGFRNDTFSSRLAFTLNRFAGPDPDDQGYGSWGVWKLSGPFKQPPPSAHAPSFRCTTPSRHAPPGGQHHPSTTHVAPIDCWTHPLHGAGLLPAPLAHRGTVRELVNTSLGVTPPSSRPALSAVCCRPWGARRGVRITIGYYPSPARPIPFPKTTAVALWKRRAWRCDYVNGCGGSCRGESGGGARCFLLGVVFVYSRIRFLGPDVGPLCSFHPLLQCSSSLLGIDSCAGLPAIDLRSRGVHLIQTGPGTERGSRGLSGCKPAFPESDRVWYRSAGQIPKRHMNMIAKSFATRFAPIPHVVRHRMENSHMSLAIVK